MVQQNTPTAVACDRAMAQCASFTVICSAPLDLGSQRAGRRPAAIGHRAANSARDACACFPCDPDTIRQAAASKRPCGRSNRVFLRARPLRARATAPDTPGTRQSTRRLNTRKNIIRSAICRWAPLRARRDAIPVSRWLLQRALPALKRLPSTLVQVRLLPTPPVRRH